MQNDNAQAPVNEVEQGAPIPIGYNFDPKTYDRQLAESIFVESFQTMSKIIFADNSAKGFWDMPPEAAKLKEFLSGNREILELYQQKIIQEAIEKMSQRNVGELLMLQTSELGEALEAHRKDLNDDHIPHRKGLEVELADCVIRIMDASAGLGLDVGTAILEKLAYNRSRPHKHGKAY